MASAPSNYDTLVALATEIDNLNQAIAFYQDEHESYFQRNPDFPPSIYAGNVRTILDAALADTDTDISTALIAKRDELQTQFEGTTITIPAS